MLTIMPSRTVNEEQQGSDDEEKQLVIANQHDAHHQYQTGTLLPRPFASLVSASTGIGSFGLKAGIRVAGWGIYAGRESTLKTLSLGRSAAENILYYAGRDIASRATSEQGHEDAENILFRSLDLLNSAISTASFAAAGGFYSTEWVLNQVSGSTVKLLSTVNNIFGSTESSKAVAAVIRLLTNELNKPEAGEVLSYWSILSGVMSFLLLQRWARRKTQLEFRDSGGEETVWDAVIDDRGFRADVVGTRRQQTVHLNAGHAPPVMSFASPDGDAEFDALERGTLVGDVNTVLAEDDQTIPSDEEIYTRIVNQLPDDAIVNITTETIEAKTIKVEIRHRDTAHIEAPPGTVMLAERLNQAEQGPNDGPSQTIVFRTALKRLNTAGIGPGNPSQAIVSDPSSARSDHAGYDDALTMSPSIHKAISSANQDAGKHTRDGSDVEDTDSGTATPSQYASGPAANQKKSRKPVLSFPSAISTKPPQTKPTSRDKSAKSTKQEAGKKFRKALRTLSPTSSVTTMKDTVNGPPRRKADAGKPLPNLPRFTLANEGHNVTPPRIYPMPSLSIEQSPVASPLAGSPLQTASSSYFSVQRSRRNSNVSQTDIYSVHSESRPGSPTFTRTHTRTVSGVGKTKSEMRLSVGDADSLQSSDLSRHHSRHRSFVPSLYSMGSKHSGEAVVLQPRKPIPRKSIYEDSGMIDTLIAEGKVPGTFPDRHLVKTVRRFARFASASYGRAFLQFMGLTEEGKPPGDSKEEISLDVHHHEHKSFSAHTGLPSHTIILSSFYDPQGVTGAEWSWAAMSPLIHFVSLDHESKAVVLTCRGTLGFEDILTDMTCDYDDIVWQGHTYKVHRGIHASARRLIGGSGSRVMATIKATLDENPEYGLVLCGHSLGGAVAALAAILISEPTNNTTGQAFVTSAPPKFLTQTSSNTVRTSVPPIQLPAGRPIHVYSYGTPATVSEPLRLATRGLITTVVNASDIFPSLSLGTLHDFRSIALHLKHDTSDAAKNVTQRVWKRIRQGLHFDATTMPNGPPLPEDMAGDGVGEDEWAWTLLQQLRGLMTNFKLVPPGEVFILETTRVFDRLSADVKKEMAYGADVNDDNKTEKVYRALGRPATRVQLKWIRDVQGRFAELRFGRDMFGDHSPGRYESGLSALENGVCDE